MGQTHSRAAQLQRKRVSMRRSATGEDASAINPSKHFSGCEVTKLLREFMEEHPSGIISEAEFTQAYASFFPYGNSSCISKHIFRAMDRSGNGFISFSEYLSVLGVMGRGTTSDKLRFAFQVYDIDGSGYVTLDEFCEIRTALEALRPVRKSRSHATLTRQSTCPNCQCSTLPRSDTRLSLAETSSVITSYESLLESTHRGPAPRLSQQRSMSMVSLTRPSLSVIGCTTRSSDVTASSLSSEYCRSLPRSPRLDKSRLCPLSEDQVCTTSSSPYGHASTLSSTPTSSTSSRHSSNSSSPTGTLLSRRSSTLSFTQGWAGQGSVFGHDHPMFDAELDSVEELFEEMDEDKDGLISFSEFQRAANRDPTLIKLLNGPV
ncbi:uncharacterized protein LOC135812423 [Sycon ciliatum]|uniref:uncharacterized protein LOC135812423 n=1 Tax=Sycon ciliatum TaxID=27933 RepID=UPI0031F6F7AE